MIKCWYFFSSNATINFLLYYQVSFKYLYATQELLTDISLMENTILCIDSMLFIPSLIPSYRRPAWGGGIMVLWLNMVLRGRFHYENRTGKAWAPGAAKTTLYFVVYCFFLLGCIRCLHFLIDWTYLIETEVVNSENFEFNKVHQNNISFN